MLIVPDSLSSVLSALTDRVGIEQLDQIDGVRLDQEGMRAFADNTPSRSERPYSIDEGVAIVPLVGTLVQKSGSLRPRSGMTGYDGTEALLWQALDDPQVDSVLLDISSGGGELAGCLDLSDMIYEMRSIKPIYAFAGELAASAAYAIGSSASKLFLPRTGTVGSVGVVVAHKSIEGAMKEKGIKVTLIHSGDHKVDGNPYQDLPDDVKEAIQEKIDSSRRLFAERVAVYRGMSVESVLNTEAAVFTGQKAVDIGFADAVMSFNEVLNIMKKNEAGADAPIITSTANAEVVVDEAMTATVATITTIAESEDETMDAVDLVDACDASDFSMLAPDMIRAGFTEEEVSLRLTDAQDIRDLCVAAGIEEDQILANLGNPVELVRSMIAMQDEAEIDSTHSGVIVNDKPATMTTAEIWKHRKSESANRH